MDEHVFDTVVRREITSKYVHTVDGKIKNSMKYHGAGHEILWKCNIIE